ncbi:MAG TPA: 6-phosphofructokinase [Bacteroidota bacterium]|nr:6-phosphofructokinase [Bacteroidota bacterium]
MRSGNILVAQGGGPTSVVNCSLVGVVEEAKRSGRKKVNGIIGAVHGIDGIINEQLIDLRKEPSVTLKGIHRKPGAALGSCRRKMAEDDYGRIIEVFRKYDVRYFLYIGGNGSMHTAHTLDRLAKTLSYGLTVVGLPKTIDNDLAHTDHCPGFGSAARYYASVTREIGLDVASLPPPISVIETLGRNTGWLAAASALARDKEDDAPNLIYCPERVFDLETFLSDVKKIYDRLGRAVVVVSEGLKDESGLYLGGNKNKASRDGFGRDLPGGAASFLAEEISSRLHIRARSEKPGLAARTSIEHVSKVDQREAYLAGQTAARYALNGESGVMMTLERKPGKKYHCAIGAVRLEEVAIAEKMLPKNFINSRGNDVTNEFIDYCRPLIGDSVRSFSSLTSRKFTISKSDV